VTWTRITDSEQAVEFLPVWFGTRMIGLRGKFDVLRITSVTALHESSAGAILLDVLLDHPGVPDGVDLAWRTKHYLGAPVPGATMATVNLAHIVTAVEFVVAEVAESPDDLSVISPDEIQPDAAIPDPLAETLERRPQETA
jgi:hypothetical protein